MLWLYILLGIVMLIMIILFLPINLFAEYNKDFNCILKVGFIKFRIYPPKPAKNKKQKKTTKKQNKAQKEKPKTNLLKEKGLSWFVDLIKKVADLAKNVLKDFFSHIILKKFMLSIKIAGDDAADTAIKYGACCSAVYPSVGIITRAVRCKNYGVDIVPDFDEKAESQLYFLCEAKVLLFRVLALVVKYGIKSLKLFAELKN